MPEERFVTGWKSLLPLRGEGKRVSYEDSGVVICKGLEYNKCKKEIQQKCKPATINWLCLEG